MVAPSKLQARMTISWTLSRYLARQFLTSVGMVFGLCVTLGFVIDIVELLNRTSGKETVYLPTIVGMALSSCQT